jgi:ABC-type Fe3+ transport system permease subunit
MTALAFLADASVGLIVLSGSATALIIAYVVRFLSLSFGTLEAGYTQIAPGLDMAARSLRREYERHFNPRAFTAFARAH